MIPTFAIVGAAGYIAPRHVETIHAIGGDLVAAVDPATTVGYLDRIFPRCRYFQTIEELVNVQFDYLVICTPNYLHVAHCLLGQRLALRGVICEKPLSLNSSQITPLCEGDVPVHTILQLRHHPEAIALRAELGNGPYQVKLRYTAIRGDWYWKSWKGIDFQSGGILFNIGIHLFDLLTWLFGPIVDAGCEHTRPDFARGVLTFATAEVEWVLAVQDEGTVQRELSLQGPGGSKVIDFSNGFTDLHQKCYEAIVCGGITVGVREAQDTVRLVERLLRP